MNFGLAVYIFTFIFVAELPDKTAIASLVLATRYRPMVVFTGAAVALMIQSILAIVAGSLFALLPTDIVHRVAGVLFLIFAVLMWIRNQEEEEKKEIVSNEASRFKDIGTVFITVFLAEWGDLTQLATATLAAKYNDPISVFVGATLALWSVAALAVLVGNRASLIFNPAIMQKVAAVVFAILGILLLVGII